MLIAIRSHYECATDLGERTCNVLKAAMRMMMSTTKVQPVGTASATVDQPEARVGLALMRLTIGVMFVWVFFEDWRKGLYTPTGYASLIHYYIENGDAPGVWKSVMALAATHAPMAGPLQAFTESSLGVLLVLGLLTRPAALVAFAFLSSLWVSEWGTGWIWELLVPVMVSLALAVGAAGRTWGVDAFLSRKWQSSLWW